MSHCIDLLQPQSVDTNQLHAVARLLCRVWPKPGRTVEGRLKVLSAEMTEYDGLASHAPRGFAVFEGGCAVAYAAILPRTIAVDGVQETIAGLARVCTDPEWRGCGLGEAVVRAAFETVDSGSFLWSLFQTSHAVRPFYDRLGSTLVSNRVVNSLGEDPEANPFWDEIVMRYPASAPPPEGTIDLLGPGY